MVVSEAESPPIFAVGQRPAIKLSDKIAGGSIVECRQAAFTRNAAAGRKITIRGLAHGDSPENESLDSSSLQAVPAAGILRQCFEMTGEVAIIRSSRGVAQLGERRVRNAKVGSSILLFHH